MAAAPPPGGRDAVRAYYEAAFDTYAAGEALWPEEQFLVDRFVPPDAAVLDLGAGPGRTTVALARRAAHKGRIWALDVVPRYARTCADRLRGVAPARAASMVADATALPFLDASFDAVLFFAHGIENVLPAAARQNAVREMARVVRPGGVAILSSHNRYSAPYAPHHVKKLLHDAADLILPRTVSRPYPELQPLELGDILYRDSGGGPPLPTHVADPFSLRRALRAAGLAVTYFNSRERILEGRPPSFSANFGSRVVYYVGRRWSV